MKSKVILGVVLVFVLGVVSGVLLTHLLYNYKMESILTGKEHHKEDSIVKRLDRRLDLDERQEEQVRAIVHQGHEEIEALRNQLRPQTEAIIEKSQAQIRLLLRPDQLKKYEQMIAERKERIRKR